MIKTLLILFLLFAAGCNPLPRQTDYEIKIKRYSGRDDLTMREQQQLWVAIEVKEVKQL